MRVKHHVCTNIEGLLRIVGRKKINFMEDESGKTVSDAEARAYIKECQDKGYKYLPVSDCEGF